MYAWFKTEHSLDDSRCRMFQFHVFAQIEDLEVLLQVTGFN
jgi:hypothetical protein